MRVSQESGEIADAPFPRVNIPQLVASLPFNPCLYICNVPSTTSSLRSRSSDLINTLIEQQVCRPALCLFPHPPDEINFSLIIHTFARERSTDRKLISLATPSSTENIPRRFSIGRTMLTHAYTHARLGVMFCGLLRARRLSRGASAIIRVCLRSPSGTKTAGRLFFYKNTRRNCRVLKRDADVPPSRT